MDWGRDMRRSGADREWSGERGSRGGWDRGMSRGREPSRGRELMGRGRSRERRDRSRDREEWADRGRAGPRRSIERELLSRLEDRCGAKVPMLGPGEP